MGLGSRGVGGLDAFVDAGDDYGGVAGELAGGVDGVLEPGASGQAGGIEEGRAESLMTPLPYTLPESSSLGEAVMLMSEHRIHHVMVVSPAGAVVGIISPLDVVDIIAASVGAQTSAE